MTSEEKKKKLLLDFDIEQFERKWHAVRLPTPNGTVTLIFVEDKEGIEIPLGGLK